MNDVLGHGSGDLVQQVGPFGPKGPHGISRRPAKKELMNRSLKPIAVCAGIIVLAIAGAIAGGNANSPSQSSAAPAATTTSVAPNPSNLTDAAPDFSSWTNAQIAAAAQTTCTLFADNNGSLTAVENAEANTNTIADSQLTPSDLALLILYSAETYCPTYLSTVDAAL